MCWLVEVGSKLKGGFHIVPKNDCWYIFKCVESISFFLTNYQESCARLGSPVAQLVKKLTKHWPKAFCRLTSWASTLLLLHWLFKALYVTSLCTCEQRMLTAADTKTKIYPWCVYNEYYQKQFPPVFSGIQCEIQFFLTLLALLCC